MTKSASGWRTVGALLRLVEPLTPALLLARCCATISWMPCAASRSKNSTAAMPASW
ncbi:MAG: hypothetical protein Q4A49_03630 [Neisseria sp.]|nr:hypothetical protein [Neisseria sp.]